MLSRINKPAAPTTKAFGLVELLVSISIMVLVMSVIITRQSSFNGAVILRDQAYELAFTIRQAQLLAVSGGDEDVRTYGVYLNTASNQQTQYILFQDLGPTPNGKYDPGEQIGLTGKLDARFEIRKLSYNADANSTSDMWILFTRPNFDARFCTNNVGCVTTSSFLTGPLEIDVARAGTLDTDTGDGDVRRVEVTSTGQITVVTYPQP